MSRVLLMLMAAMPLAACASSPPPAAAPVARRAEPRPPEVTDSAIALGRAVYNGRGSCHYCHGPNGRGGALGPDLTDGTWLRGDGSYRSLVERVVHGGAAAGDSARLPMPERRVTDLRYRDVSAVAAYVWSLREQR